MSENQSEKSGSTGFKPFLVVFGILVVVILLAKFLYDKLM